MVASTILWTAKVALPNNWNGTKKLWWVHIETLISLLKGYQLTGDKQCNGVVSRKYMSMYGRTSKMLNILNGSVT